LDRLIAVKSITPLNPAGKIYASYPKERYYFTHHGFAIIPEEGMSVKYLLTILNSKLINFYHSYKFLDIEKRLFQKLLIENCKKDLLKK